MKFKSLLILRTARRLHSIAAGVKATEKALLSSALSPTQSTVLAAIGRALDDKLRPDRMYAPPEPGLSLQEAIAACYDEIEACPSQHRATRIREAIGALVKYDYLVFDPEGLHLPE